MSLFYPDIREAKKIALKNKNLISFILALSLIKKLDIKNSFSLLILLIHNGLIDTKQGNRILEKKL